MGKPSKITSHYPPPLPLPDSTTPSSHKKACPSAGKADCITFFANTTIPWFQSKQYDYIEHAHAITSHAIT